MSFATESGISNIGKIPWGSHFCHLIPLCAYANILDCTTMEVRAGLHHGRWNRSPLRDLATEQQLVAYEITEKLESKTPMFRCRRGCAPRGQPRKQVKTLWPASSGTTGET